MLLLSILAGVIPSTLYLWILNNVDKYKRVKTHFLLMHFLWGATGAILLSVSINAFLVKYSLFFFTKINHIVLLSVVIAPITEEILKAVFLFYSINNKKYINIVDGIIYGAAIGFGFAMTENIFYFISSEAVFSHWAKTVFIRVFFTSTMHATATAIIGGALGYSKFYNKESAAFLPLAGIIVSFALHACWNELTDTNRFVFALAILLSTIITLIVIFNNSVKKDEEIILEELKEEEKEGLFPLSHIEIVSVNKNHTILFGDKEIIKTFLKSSALLALRRRQLKSCDSEKQLQYIDEITSLRAIISNCILLIEKKPDTTNSRDNI